MKVFIWNCKKLSIFWIVSFVSLLSVSLADSLKNNSSIGLKILYWLIIAFTVVSDFWGTYDTFKKSFRKKDNFDSSKLGGFVKTLRVLLIVNLILVIIIVSIFGGIDNKSGWGYIFASTFIFVLFLMVKSLFIFGSFKLGKIAKELHQQNRSMYAPKTEITLKNLEN